VRKKASIVQLSERPRVALAKGTRLGVVGAGAMGRALLRGLLQSGVGTEQLWAATHSSASAEAVRADLAVRASDAYAPFVPESDVVVLAVKPAQIGSALKQLAVAGLRPGTLVVSVAAGVTTRRLEEALPANPVVRVMSNTPCFVGEGMTAIAPGSRATPEHLALTHDIFAAVGRCITIEERHLDAVTAISGSGPAYIYLVIEALADAGVRVGLPRETAMTLVTQTVLGAATMVERSDRHPASLRDDVTTPAGCTIGALLVLEDGKIRSVLARAVEEARDVLRELAAAQQEAT